MNGSDLTLALNICSDFSCRIGEMEAEELIDLRLAGDDTGKTNDVDSRLIVTNCTKSCNFFTCCLSLIRKNDKEESIINLSILESIINDIPTAC